MNGCGAIGLQITLLYTSSAYGLLKVNTKDVNCSRMWSGSSSDWWMWPLLVFQLLFKNHWVEAKVLKWSNTQCAKVTKKCSRNIFPLLAQNCCKTQGPLTRKNKNIQTDYEYHARSVNIRFRHQFRTFEANTQMSLAKCVQMWRAIGGGCIWRLVRANLLPA